MKKKQFTHGVNFYVTQEMYEEARSVTDEQGIGLSELCRQLLRGYLGSFKNNRHDNLNSQEDK